MSIPMSQIDSRSAALLANLRKTLHDLNNALTPIMANAQLARLMIEPSEGDLGETLDDVVAASGRSNVLVSEMRELVRELQDALSGPDLNEGEDPDHG